MSELPPSPPPKPKLLPGLLLIFALLAVAVVIAIKVPIASPPAAPWLSKERAGFLGGGRVAGHRAQCINDMRCIALALLNYESTHGCFPPVYTTDADGQPLHSWRVLILPYLEQTPLYEAIRLDEPWNSPHNTAFHRESIRIFQCPSMDYRPGECAYSVIVGPGTVFEEDGQSISVDDITNGTANTILLVERAVPLDCWMDPTREITLDEAKKGVDVSSDGIGSRHPGGTNAAFCDSSVRFLINTITPPLLEEKLIRNHTAP